MKSAGYFSCLLLLCAMLCGCTVHYIMDYDPIIDQSFTNLQQATEVFLAKLQASPGTTDTSYANTKDFYTQANATLQTMRTRVSVDPKSKDVNTQIDALQKSFDTLQRIQMRAGVVGPGAEVIKLEQGPIETEFAAIFQLQIALKTRLKPASATAPTLK